MLSKSVIPEDHLTTDAAKAGPLCPWTHAETEGITEEVEVSGHGLATVEGEGNDWLSTKGDLGAPSCRIAWLLAIRG